MSEKLPDGTYIADYSNPDLDLIFAGKKDYRFAVECKWRKQFKNGKINWATEKQIIAYKKFQSREAITVFIAIGVGGTASSPEKLFVTPLCNLENIPEVYEHQLIKYKRKPTQRFFYNTVIPGLT